MQTVTQWQNMVKRCKTEIPDSSPTFCELGHLEAVVHYQSLFDHAPPWSGGRSQFSNCFHRLFPIDCLPTAAKMPWNVAIVCTIDWIIKMHRPAVFRTSRGTCAEMFSGVTIPMYLGSLPSSFPTSERQAHKRISPFKIVSESILMRGACHILMQDFHFNTVLHLETTVSGRFWIGTNGAESWSNPCNIGKGSHLSLRVLQTFHANIITIRPLKECCSPLVSTHNFWDVASLIRN